MQYGTPAVLETDCIILSVRTMTCFLFRQLILNLSAHRKHLGSLNTLMPESHLQTDLIDLE